MTIRNNPPAGFRGPRTGGLPGAVMQSSADIYDAGWRAHAAVTWQDLGCCIVAQLF